MNACRPQRLNPGIRPAARQSGAALVISLLMMLLITLLGVSMMRSVGMETRILGSTGEKQHAFHNSQTALQYAEWWLVQANNASTGVSCSSGQSALPVVCNAASAPSNFATVDWTTIGTPLANISTAEGGLFTIPTSGSAPAADTTSRSPAFFITYLGISGTNQSKVYQINATGYGGNANAVAVVQSIYLVSSTVKCLDQENCK